MRVVIAFAFLALSIWLGGCSRASPVVYVKPVIFREFPKPTTATAEEAKLSASPTTSVHPPITVETKVIAADMAQEAPKDIVASQIRSQGYDCNLPQSAKRDWAASKAHVVVWTLDCQNASYRVTLVPSMAAKVDKVGDASPRSSGQVL